MVVGLLLAACGSDAGDDTAGGAAAAGDATTVENCGEELTFAAPPERAVPVDQNVTEMLLALGLEDHVAAYARQHFNPRQPVLPAYQEAYDGLDKLADTAPSRELFLQARPDFALAAFGFADDSGLSRSQLLDDGIPTYLLPDQCPDRTEPVGFDDLYRTMRDLGTIFDASAEAEDLIDGWEETLAEVEDRVGDEEPASVFVYDSGEDTPFTVGGTGQADAIIEAAGGVNIYADEDQQFFDGNWETVLDADPDVVVIMNYFHDGDDGADAEAKVRIIEDRLAGTTAVEAGRVEVLDLTGFFLSVRNADTVAALADVLHP